MSTKTNVSDAVLHTARARGLSYLQIGLALGVSHQAIQSRIGGDHKWVSKQSRSIHFVRCAFCKEPTEIRLSRLKIYENHFCSPRCHGMGDRRVQNTGAVLAMNLRLNGYTWTGVAGQIGYPIQTIQYNIWRLLCEKGFLTSDIVHAIWRPAPSISRKTFSVKHLINRNGLSPRGTKKYTDFSQWVRAA